MSATITVELPTRREHPPSRERAFTQSNPTCGIPLLCSSGRRHHMVCGFVRHRANHVIAENTVLLSWFVSLRPLRLLSAPKRDCVHAANPPFGHGVRLQVTCQSGNILKTAKSHLTHPVATKTTKSPHITCFCKLCHCMRSPIFTLCQLQL